MALWAGHLYSPRCLPPSRGYRDPPVQWPCVRSLTLTLGPVALTPLASGLAIDLTPLYQVVSPWVATLSPRFLSSSWLLRQPLCCFPRCLPTLACLKVLFLRPSPGSTESFPTLTVSNTSQGSPPRRSGSCPFINAHSNPVPLSISPSPLPEFPSQDRNPKPSLPRLSFFQLSHPALSSSPSLSSLQLLCSWV